MDADLELQRVNPNHHQQPRDEDGKFAAGSGAGSSGDSAGKSGGSGDDKGKGETPKGKASAREAGSKAHKALSDAREHLSDGKSHDSKEVQGALETAKGHLKTAMESLDVGDAARAGYQAGHATVDDVSSGKYPSGKGAQAIMALKSAQLRINNAHKAVARVDAPDATVDTPAETPADDVTIVTNEAAPNADNNAATVEATTDEIDTALQAEIAAETPAATERAETNLPVIRGEVVTPQDEPLTRGVIHGLASRFSLPSGARDALLIAHHKGVLTTSEHVLRVIAAATDAEYLQRGDWTKAITAHGVGGALEGQPHRAIMVQRAAHGWDESQHPRDESGKFGSGGGVNKSEVGKHLLNHVNANTTLEVDHGSGGGHDFDDTWNNAVKKGHIDADNAHDILHGAAMAAKDEKGEGKGPAWVDSKHVKKAMRGVHLLPHIQADYTLSVDHDGGGGAGFEQAWEKGVDSGAIHAGNAEDVLNTAASHAKAGKDGPAWVEGHHVEKAIKGVKRADQSTLQRGQTSESVPVRENLAGGSTGPAAMKGDKPVTGKVKEMKVYRHDGCPILHLTAEDAEQCDNDGTVDRMESLDVTRMAGLDAQPLVTRMEALAADNTMLLTRAEQAEQLATQTTQELTAARGELETTLNRLSTVEGEVARREAEINTLRNLPLERRAVVQYPAVPVARGFAMNQMVTAPDVQRQQEVADALQRAEHLRAQADAETNASKRAELVVRLMSANLELRRLGITA